MTDKQFFKKQDAIFEKHFTNSQKDIDHFRLVDGSRNINDILSDVQKVDIPDNYEIELI